MEYELRNLFLEDGEQATLESDPEASISTNAELNCPHQPKFLLQSSFSKQNYLHLQQLHFSLSYICVILKNVEGQ